MASGVPRSLITHSQRVCRLYKAAARMTENNFYRKCEMRYHVVLLRARFDETKKETDMSKLAGMLEAGEEELWRNQVPEKFYFKKDPGGISYDRDPEVPDAVLDMWHPWEKANYIDYFETREKRKPEYVDYYENSLLKKGLLDLEKVDYPTIGPEMTRYEKPISSQASK